MRTEDLAFVGIAIVGIAAGAFAAFSHDLPPWVRWCLAAAGLAVLIAAVTLL